ncbi:hypothetical protein [Carboxylicivirga marina]|uniref:Uncharacterized protein n=1 Tax=Carboxylicivirga marina TaxID=2800988 RepID=A0ABS1HLU8_9BACT|nr:hypothetical protein [Carboxylicivirga marina]MBK3518646.1 hypothetical protein [Carboxylicivirga marina]
MEQYVFGSYFKGTEIEERRYVEGEIICIDDSTMTLMTLNNKKNTIVLIKKHHVKDGLIYVALSSNNANSISMWSSANMLLPLSHGAYGVITLPLNIIVGAGISYDTALSPYSIMYPSDISWNQMNKFARFPGGLPEGVKIEDIKLR